MNQINKIVKDGKVFRCDYYEWVISQLEAGNFSEEDEESVLANLASVEITKKGVEILSPKDCQEFYTIILKKMKNGNFLPDLLLWSASYYYFSKAGVNTFEMREVINNSPILYTSSLIHSFN